MYVRSVLCLLLLVVENVAASSPLVKFNPDWNKFFIGESINVTCDVDSIVEEDVTYLWFKDGYWIHSGKTFTISSAKTSNGGSYQCQTSAGDRSDPVRLEILNSYVILQASPYVYEGDNLTLRCRHNPGYTAGQTIFYQNNAIIKGWGSEDELLIENINMTSSSKYKCTKQVSHHLLYYQHTDETSISVQELFSVPTIRWSPQAVTEGDHLTLSCDTRISPLRQATPLRFSFHKDGRTVREFGSSNKYEITSTKQEDSGDYQCEVRTPNDGMKKMSATLTVQVNGKSEDDLSNHIETEVSSKPGTNHFIAVVSVTSLVLVLGLIVTALIFLYRARQLQTASHQWPPKVAEPKEPEDVTENIYTELDTSDGWKNFSQDPQKPHFHDLKTENHFISC